jgi:hypothetical protein
MFSVGKYQIEIVASLFATVFLAGCSQGFSVNPSAGMTVAAASGSTLVPGNILNLPDPTSASVSQAGPYAVQSYTTGIAVPAGSSFASPGIYFPVNGPVLSPALIYIAGLDADWTVVRKSKSGKVEAYHYSWGEFLASYGFTVMFINPTDLTTGQQNRSKALLEATTALIAENQRVDSPIYNKIDVNNIGLMGHAEGGGGAILAASSNSNPAIKIAVALSPIGGTAYNDQVPVLVVGGQYDPYENPTGSKSSTNDLFVPQYNSVPSGVAGELAQVALNTEFDSMQDVALDPLGWHKTDPVVARETISFIMSYMMNDPRFLPFVSTDPLLNIFSYRP